jgi:hypothetical protein
LANIYVKTDESIMTLVNHVMQQWHSDLAKARVRVGVLFALSARESQPALKENGHAVDGTIKIVPLKDRVTKDFDVEMLLDGDEWGANKQEHRLAIIDHLLMRLEVRKPKLKKKKKRVVHGDNTEREDHEEPEFLSDDIGRPILKLRKGDWNAGIGFRDVVVRHGAYSIEARNLERARVIVEEAIKMDVISIEKAIAPLALVSQHPSKVNYVV